MTKSISSPYHQIGVRHGLFDSVEEPNAIVDRALRRSAHDDPDRAARMQRSPSLADDGAQDDDLRPRGKDQSLVLMDAVGHAEWRAA